MVPFVVESWTWYSFAMSMVIARVTSRFVHCGLHFRTLKSEDWLMLFTACLYTALIVFLNIAIVLPTNYVLPAELPLLDPSNLSLRVRGSKFNMLSEVFQNAIQWTVKGCMLLLYCRVFKDLTHRIILILVTAYVVVTYIVQQGLYFGYWCHPFQNMWAVPAENIQCAFPSHHMILNVTLNVTSDLMIFLIPLPLFLRSSLPWKRKLMLVLPFTMGFFTIFAAIICKIEALYLLNDEWWGVWCLREASMAVIVANVPYSWGLVRVLTNVGSFLLPSADESPAFSPLSSHTSSKFGLLRAARSNLSFGSSRKQSSANRSTGAQGFSDDFFVKNDQWDDRRPSNPIRYLPNAARHPSPSRARQSISAAAVDKLYKLDSSEKILGEKQTVTTGGTGHGHSHQSRSWAPKTADFDKSFGFNECCHEKDGMSCLDDDADASSNEKPGECLNAQQFSGKFEFRKGVGTTSGDTV